jgi:ribosomal protein L21E
MKLIGDKKSLTRRSHSDEEKRNTRNKVQSTWRSKSSEELQEYAEMCRARTTEMWSNMSQEDRSKMYQLMKDAQRKYLDSLSDEELLSLKDKMSKRTKLYWESMNKEDRDLLIQRMSEGHKNQWAKLTMEERANISRKISEAQRKHWNNMTPEEFQRWNKSRAIAYNNYINSIGILPNKNEMDLIKHLDGLNYHYQYHSTIKHKDFDTLFPSNPITGSNLVSPYHSWDFMILCKIGDILIDIDGSIHNNESYERIHPLTGVKYNILEYQKFNDSQRPYQTDGLDAYVIQCYDNDLNDNTPVISLSDNTSMDFKKFKEVLSEILIINDMSNEELHELFNDI